MIITTPRTWVAGETVTAALMNVEIRNALAGIQAAWTSYTPTFTTSGTAPALGNGTLTGAWTCSGKTAHFRLKFTAGSTTTYGSGNLRFGLPATSNGETVCTAFLHDASAGNGYAADSVAHIAASTAFAGVYVGSIGSSNVVTGVFPVTFATGDRIWVSGTFETT